MNKIIVVQWEGDFRRGMRVEQKWIEIKATSWGAILSGVAQFINAQRGYSFLEGGFTACSEEIPERVSEKEEEIYQNQC